MAGDTAAIIQVIDICIVWDRSVRGPGVLNIPPTSYLAPNCLHWIKCPRSKNQEQGKYHGGWKIWVSSVIIAKLVEKRELMAQ